MRGDKLNMSERSAVDGGERGTYSSTQPVGVLKQDI